MSKAAEHALDAIGWAQLAIKGLHDAAANLAEVSREVARDAVKGDERFIGARTAVDTAWDQITNKALYQIAAARNELRLADAEARAAAQAGEGDA